MRLRIICGNDECRQEYSTDTMDRYWECPHCGRVRENDFYPFLSARMMQARINGKDEDWEAVHEDIVNKADLRVQEKNVRLRRLEGDLDVPDDEAHPDSIGEMANVIKDIGSREGLDWRARSELLMKEARKIIVAQEDRIAAMEKEKDDRRKKRAKG
jgi:endogenous inhibitor of DNA gyrase (YacG/DUF329 family)